MSQSAPLFDKASVVGLGLIGSSMTRALNRHGLAGALIGCDACEQVRARAVELALADTVTDDIAKAADADVVIVATPVGAAAAVFDALAPHLKPGTIVTDVGSVKGAVAKLAGKLPDHVHFVPGHPIAGTEQSGPDAGFAELFENRWCVLTPLEGHGAADADGAAYAAAVDKVEAMWRGCGSEVERMDAAHHDLALAMTSHLPHLIAYTMVGAADDLETVTEAEVVKYSAGGFRDFTRIAASDPVMWRDVFLHNSEAVLEVLGRFSEELAALQRAIRWKDADQLFTTFSRTRELRRRIVEAGQENPAPNFGRDTGRTDGEDTE
ncbi:MAG: prephenate/arogenate dehydrogenase family protein [Pseudomonadota bacterium]